MAGETVDLDQLATQLAAVSTWLAEQPARHADYMSEVVDQALDIIEDLADERRLAENGHDRD